MRTAMADLTVLVPGSLERLTGGTLYDKRIVRGLRALGLVVDVHEIPTKFALGDDTTRRVAEDTLCALPEGARVVVDGLILPALSDLLTCHAARLRIIVLLHLPVTQAAGLPDVARRELRAREADGLATAFRIIVPSQTVRRLLIGAGVSRSRLGVVVPGTDPAPSACGSGKSGFARLLCVAAVTEGKGHELLVEALAKLKHLVWELECVGSVDREPAIVAALRRMIARHDMEKRCRLVGEMPQEALAEVYGRADVFVLASVFESYGMALAEALARGLPVVSTTGGAISEIVPRTAGLLVEPGNPTGLSQALEAVINDPALRARLAAGARAVGRRLPTWAEATTRFAEEVLRA